MISNRILERAKKYFQHDMIVTYTELPPLPHVRAELLYTFLKRGSELTIGERELFPLVTTLMQVALDTHDTVKVAHDRSEDKVDRTTQLRVLGGAYFSSRFYQLLAQAGQVEWVKLLSVAICEVNRMKLNLYTTMQQLKLTAEEYMQQTIQIKTRMFRAFNDVFEGALRTIWPDLLESFTRCELISEELDRTNTLQDFQNSWMYWYIMDNGSREERRRMSQGLTDPQEIESLLQKYDVKSKLQHMLEYYYKQLKDKVAIVGSDKLANELTALSDRFLQSLPQPKVL